MSDHPKEAKKGLQKMLLGLKMSTQPNEAKKMLQPIAICNDILLHVFDRVDLAVLGLSFALVSARFNSVVNSHFASRPWALGEWEIRRKTEGTGAELVGKDAKGNAKQLPMPEVPPLDNVVGFKKLTISFVDQSVLTFLHRIAPRLFGNQQQFIKVVLEVKANERNSWSIIANTIWPLVAQNVFDLSIGYHALANLRRMVSYSVLTDCARLQQMSFSGIYPGDPPSDSSGANSSNAFYKWLLTPDSSGNPKVMNYMPPTFQFEPTVSLLKEQFINSTTRAFFVIGFVFWVGISPFSLVNERTGERMRLYKAGEFLWSLERGPTEWGEKRWAEWTAESGKVHAKGNEVVVHIGDEDVDKCSQIIKK